MIGTGLSGIDADRLDGIDRLQHSLDLRPTGNAQQDLAAGAYIGDRRIGLIRPDGAQDVDARDDGAEAVSCPANVSEDAAWREAENAPAPVEDLLGDLVTKAYPVLDLLLDPDQFDMREAVGLMRDHPLVFTSSRNSRRGGFGTVLCKDALPAHGPAMPDAVDGHEVGNVGALSRCRMHRIARRLTMPKSPDERFLLRRPRSSSRGFACFPSRASAAARDTTSAGIIFRARRLSTAGAALQ